LLHPPACPPPHPQLKYSWLVSGLRQENIQLNRKMLSELAMCEPHSFKALVEQVQHMRGLNSSSSSSSTPQG
jgi:large subunit ribosomal protein L20